MAVAAAERMPGDPVLRALGPRFMTRGTRLTPWARSVVAGFVAVTAAVVLLRPSLTLTGTPIPALSNLDAQQMAAWSFVVVPVALFLYFWIPGSVQTLVTELIEQNVVVGPKPGVAEDAGEFAERSMHRFARPLGQAAAVILIVAYSLYLFPRLDTSTVPGTVDAILSIVVSAPIIYAATLAFFWMIDGIQITSTFFDRYEIRVIPHHPDGAGGLGPIGKRVTVLAWAGAIAGSAVIFINWIAIQQKHDPLKSMESVFGIGVLLVAAPLVVWFWLRAPHQAMLAARGPVLGEISAAYERVAKAPIPHGGKHAELAASLQASTDLLEQLDRRAQEIGKTYPDWPIHTTALRTAWAVVAAPIVAGIVGIVIGNFRTLLGG
jgi:hypothetical protein